MPELEAELAALRTRAEQAEASASQVEETLKVGHGGTSWSMPCCQSVVLLQLARRTATWH